MSGATGSGIGAKGSVAFDETHGRERCATIGRARKSQFLATVVAVAAVPIMVIRPDDVDAATILARCLVNSDPGFVIKNFTCWIQRHRNRETECFASIVRGRDGNAARGLVRVEDCRVDLVMGTECETDIRGYAIVFEARQDASIAPGTTTIK